MKRPEVVVFDLGKVLVDFDYGIAARRIAARCPAPAANLKELIDHSPLLYRYETGLLTTEEFFQEVCRATGYTGTLLQFIEEFSDIFWPIEPMVHMHAELMRRGVPTYIFSNTNPLAEAHIRKHFSFFQNFTGYVLSYEHRSMKPDAKIYEVVEAMTGRCGEAILYMDDRAENVEAGAQRGWQTILQVSPDTTIGRIRALGLLGDV